LIVRGITDCWLAKDAEHLSYGSVILPNGDLEGAHIVGRVENELIRTAQIAVINFETGFVATTDGQMYLLGPWSHDYKELIDAQKEGIIIATDWFIHDRNRKNFWPTRRRSIQNVYPQYEFKAKTMSCRSCRSISGEIVDQHGNHVVLKTAKGVLRDVLVIWNNMSKRQYDQIKKDDGLLINVCAENLKENFGTKSKPIFYYH